MTGKGYKDNRNAALMKTAYLGRITGFKPYKLFCRNFCCDLNQIL